MRIFSRNMKRALKSSLFGLLLAAAVAVQAFGAEAGITGAEDGTSGAEAGQYGDSGQDMDGAEELTDSPVTLDVVYGYKNIAKSGRFLPLRVELGNRTDQVFKGTLCVLAMESDMMFTVTNIRWKYRHRAVSLSCSACPWAPGWTRCTSTFWMKTEKK